MAPLNQMKLQQKIGPDRTSPSLGPGQVTKNAQKALSTGPKTKSDATGLSVKQTRISSDGLATGALTGLSRGFNCNFTFALERINQVK